MNETVGNNSAIVQGQGGYSIVHDAGDEEGSNHLEYEGEKAEEEDEEDEYEDVEDEEDDEVSADENDEF